MKLRYNYRLYPTPLQEQTMLQIAGNNRWLWNHFLRLNIEEYTKSKKFIFRYDLQKLLPGLKKNHLWLKESYAQTLQALTLDFDKALKFKKSGKKFPKFKSKHKNHGSFTYVQGTSVLDNQLYLPKIGNIRVKLSRDLPHYTSVVIYQDGDHWYASFVIEKAEESTKEIKTVVGVDINADSIVCSNGATFTTPRPTRKYRNRIKLLQRRIARKKLNSKNRKKARVKYQKLMRHIRNVQHDFAHKISSEIANQADLISMETLDIESMKSNHYSAKAVQDNNWRSILNMIAYKTKLRGTHHVFISQWLPSSKTCSHCGEKKDKLNIKQRVFACDGCGNTESRDLNASKNIMFWGYQSYTGKAIPEAPVDVLLSRLSNDDETNTTTKQELRII